MEIEKFWEAYRLDQKKILEHEKALKFTRLIWDNKIPEESLLDLINNKTLNEYLNNKAIVAIRIDEIRKYRTKARL